MREPSTICRNRLSSGESSYCLLQSHRFIDADRRVPALVFHGKDEDLPLICGPDMAMVCPFRDRPKQSDRAMVDCPYCGRRHRPDSNNRAICEAWHSVKECLRQMRSDFPGMRKYYIAGTMQLPYADDTTELARRVLWPKIKAAVLRRDRYICQDCGVNFERGRMKVYDPSMRNGKGGMRWESLEVHHIVPRSRGGSDHPGNLKTLCPACHRRYTNELVADRAQEVRGEKRLSAVLAECREMSVDPGEPFDPRD